jgi:hypothetical protein
MKPTFEKNVCRKMFRKCLSISSLLLVMYLVGCSIESLAAKSSNDVVMEKKKKVKQISPDIQFMPPIGATLPNSIEKLIIWPSQEEIKKRYAKTDISKKFPPVYMEHDGIKGKPIKEGAVSPDTANKQAIKWIRLVLKPEWIPEDIHRFIIPLRDEKPERSTVICRYNINGTSIQISQTRWAMSVLLNISDKEKIENAEAFAEATFKKYFNLGDKMAALKGKMLSKESMRNSSDVKISVLDMRELRDPEAIQSWWGWLVWANKDSTLVVFLQKKVFGEQHTTTPDEPWF